MKRLIKALLEPIAKLFRVFFDPRFEQLASRVEERFKAVELASSREREEARVAIESTVELLSFLNRSVGGFSVTLRDTQVRVDHVQREVAALKDVDIELFRHLTATPEDVEALGQRDAVLLNHAESHVGFGAKKGLWFNPAVTLRYGPGSVELGPVNERIVEVPFVFEQMASLPLGARVLDVGCAESTVSYSLASLGFQVTGIDLHPYPFVHPNLTTVAQAVEDWVPDESFDGVVCLSSIEHFGLGVYGEDETPGLDLTAMERIREWSKPGAVLALTTPFGEYRVQGQQRIYDMPALEKLLVGWDIEQISIAVRMDVGRGWQVVAHAHDFEAAAEGEHPAVALVAARMPT